MKKIKPRKPVKAHRRKSFQKGKIQVFYPLTIFLESGTFEEIGAQINLYESHGYRLSTFETARDSFFQSHRAIMSRSKTKIKVFKQGVNK